MNEFIEGASKTKSHSRAAVSDKQKCFNSRLNCARIDRKQIIYDLSIRIIVIKIKIMTII